MLAIKMMKWIWALVFLANAVEFGAALLWPAFLPAARASGAVLVIASLAALAIVFHHRRDLRDAAQLKWLAKVLYLSSIADFFVMMVNIGHMTEPWQWAAFGKAIFDLGLVPVSVAGSLWLQIHGMQNDQEP